MHPYARPHDGDDPGLRDYHAKLERRGMGRYRWPWWLLALLLCGLGLGARLR